MSGPIEHPLHYNWFDIECLDVVEHFNFNIGCVIKYAWRGPSPKRKKWEAIEDYRKAIFYLEREVERLKSEDSANGALGSPERGPE